MGKKKKINYRAEQARRRNAEKAEQRRKTAERRELWDKHGKQIIIIAVAAVAAIVLIWLGCKWFIGPDGSIPNFFGTLRGVESDWIVTNTGTTSKPRYYKMAEFADPEGYTLDPEYNISSDRLVQTRAYRANDESAPVQLVYVSGVKGYTASEQLERLQGYSFFTETSGAVSGTLGGQEVQYIYMLCPTNADEESADKPATERDGYASLCVYADSVQDSCVVVMLNSGTATLAEAPSMESMLEEADRLVAGLTLP